MLDVIEVDILVVGGGFAGSMAALSTVDRGQNVALVESAGHQRCGAGGRGNDHYHAPVIPGVTTRTVDDFIAHAKKWNKGYINEPLVRMYTRESFERLKYLEKLGIRFRDDKGNFIFAYTNSEYPEGAIIYYGRDVQPTLAKECGRRGVKVYDRTMVTKLLTKDGRVVGATGFNVRTGEFMTFKAKATILAAGGWSRGGGLTLAYNAGAELTNMEAKASHGNDRPGYPVVNACPYWCSFWPAPTVDARRNTESDRVIHRMTDPYSHTFMHAAQKEMLKMAERGEISLPLFRDTTVLSEEDIKRMETLNFLHEGNCWFMSEYMKEHGKDFRKDMWEVSPWIRNAPGDLFRLIPTFAGGLVADGNCKSSVPGLYAACPVAGRTGDGAGAMTTGWHVGGKAADYALEIERPEIDVEQIEMERDRVFTPIKRQRGMPWKELDLALRLIVLGYGGDIKTEEGLKIGLLRLSELREEALETAFASDYHELMHTMGQLAVFPVAELYFKASLERRSSSSFHVHFRTDYPKWDEEEWMKWIIVKQETGEPKFCTRPLTDIGGAESG